MAAAATVALLTAGACGSSSPTAGAGSSTTARPAAEVHVGAEHDGASVTLRQGQELSVSLASTYWDLSVTPAAGPLTVVSESTVPGGPECGHAVVGSGCGTATIVVRADRPGTASVVGQRTTCGEALRCGPGRDRYEVRVVVAG